MDEEKTSSEIIRSLSKAAQAALRKIDVVFDRQLPALNIETMALPAEDVARIRAVIARMPAGAWS